MSGPRVITLRTGVEVPRAAARAIWVSIRVRHQQNWVALYEAVQAARVPRYQPSADSAKLLRTWCLLDADGRMHDLTRAVLLASAEGDGPQMILRPPYDDDDPA